MNQKDSLTFRQKLFYGIGEISTTLSGTIVGFLYVFYLTNVMGMTAWLAGLVFLIGSIWDAITDPWVGYLSDITRSRFGRRRVYFLFSAVPFAIFFFLIWFVPAGWSELGMFFYAVITYVLYRTVSTLFIIPYTTYGMEIVEEYDGRTSLVSYRYFFSILFGLIAAAVPEMITTLPLDPAVPAGMPSVAGYMLMAGIFSIPLFISPLITFFAFREQPYNNAPRTGLFKRFVITLKNKFFRQALGMYICSWVTIGFIQGMLLYYLGVLNQEENFALIAAIIMGMAVVCLPIWVYISKKLDKRKAYMLGLGVSGLSLCVLLLPPNFVNSIIWGILPIIGFGMSAMHMLPGAILPEAIEAGEVNNSVRNDGVYFGIVTFAEKIGLAIMMQLSTVLMGVCGYISTEEGQIVTQPDSALLCIRILTGCVPLVLIITGILIARKFSIGREESRLLHAQVAAEKSLQQ